MNIYNNKRVFVYYEPRMTLQKMKFNIMEIVITT